MDKTEYITKCEALLQENSVYQHLSKDTSTIHKELIKILQDYKNNNFISKTEYTQLRPHGSNSPAARFSGLPKIQENNMPMHPIVSACGTETYNTAKFITKILQNYCGKTSSFVKDSTDFIKKIKHLSITPEEETLVYIWCQCSLYQHSSTFCTSSYQFKNFYLHQFHQYLQDFYSKIHQASGIHYHQLQLSASIRNSINNYRMQPWVHLSPHHCKYLHGILWILRHSLISNINQVVVQVCWWCPQCHQKRSSQQTSRAHQFHRSTHQIHHRTPRNRWTPLPRYPDQTHP